MNATAKRTLAGVCVGIALAHVGNYIYFPHLISTLGVEYSGFWAGFVMFLTYVGRLSSTFFYEGLGARLGTRGSVIAGIALEAVALGLMGFADGLVAYGLCAFFVGFGSGMSFPGLKNILGALPEEHRAKAFSYFQMACQTGVIAGAVVGGLFLWADMRVLFGVVFALFAGYCLAAVFVIPRDEEQDRAAAAATPLVNFAVLKGLKAGAGTRYFFLSSLFWIMSISFLVGMPLFMEEYVKGLPVSAPFWISGITLMALQYPAFRFMIKHFRPGQVMAVAFGAMALAFVLFGAGRNVLWVVVGCFVVVFGDILFTPSFDLWVTRRIPADRLARAMGAMHFFRSFGNMAGTLVAGALFDLAHNTGIPGLNWYLTAALAAACALVSLGVSARERTAEPGPDPETTPAPAPSAA
ncbi:MFS transporter [Streptomyces sp. NPDC006207]